MINLLPPQYKKGLQEEESFRLVFILGTLVLVFLICLSLLLLSIRVYVSGEIKTQQIFVEAQKKEEGMLRSEQIKELNGKIAGVSSFYAKGFLFSDIITRISGALPDGVYLTSLSYTPGNSKTKIALAGFAARTEDLLEFRDNLEQDSLFGNFHFPPSNWVRTTNVNFAFDFEI